MSTNQKKEELEHELIALREELAELRAVHSIHKHTREGLEAIELQLAGVIHSAMDAILTVDEAQHIVIFNAAAEKMFGYLAKEVIGTTIDRLIPSRFRNAHQHHIEQFGQAEITNRRMGDLGSISGLRSNGEEFPIEASISHVEVSGQKLFTVILRDITERMQAEEQIAQLGSLLDESLNEIFLFNVETLQFLQVNRSGRENLGYSIEELRYMTPVSVNPEYTEAMFRRLIEPLKGRDSKKIDFRTLHQRKDGTCYPVEVHVQLITHKTTEVFFAIILDLSERLKAETALQETQRTLSTLMTNLPGMVYRCKCDYDWTMEFLSSGCQQLTGYLPDDFIRNRRVSYGRDVIVAEDRERIWGEVQKANAVHRSFQLSYKLRTADGSMKWVWEQGSGVFAEDGTVCALEGYVFDVTQEKTLEERLRKTERLAELGTLASGMAHEIGTPMNVILGRAEFLMRKTADGNTRKGLETIVVQVERITKIMNQLLSFARKRPAERRPLDLAVIITSTLDIMRERLSSYQIQVETDIASDRSQVFADHDQLSQVLLNLIINSCHAMPEGGNLRIILQNSKNQIHLTISDTGCGIPKGDLSRLFDPFFTTKPVGEGTGLGLTVVHGIIQEHDGVIQIESELGKGTTVHIFLPGFTSGIG
ncbi:MAG: PAS domain S-box protein [Nitrospirales bacterium]